MSRKINSQQLLVEGKNDRHVIWALCNYYQLPENFSVEVPEGGTEGIEALLDGLTFKLRQEKLQTLGIVVDADRDLGARWQSIRDRLIASGYPEIPLLPPAQGWVYAPSDPFLKRVGVWVMPNNQLPGMLEDFAALLIPEDDNLRPQAERILGEIEITKINRYSIVHRSKALIHTWLAWQEVPGMPMGQAITVQALRGDSAIARVFVEWLNRLFQWNLNRELSDTQFQ